MSTIVRSNLFELLQRIERQNNKRYSWAAIGRRIKRSRQAAENLFTGDQSEDSYIKYGTMARLLEFFHQEGLADISIGDLFKIDDTNLYPVRTAGAEATRRDG